MELTSEPIVKIPTRSEVLAVAFSPFEWSRSLLAVALPSSLAVYSIKFKVIYFTISLLFLFWIFKFMTFYN